MGNRAARQGSRSASLDGKPLFHIAIAEQANGCLPQVSGHVISLLSLGLQTLPGGGVTAASPILASPAWQEGPPGVGPAAAPASLILDPPDHLGAEGVKESFKAPKAPKPKPDHCFISVPTMSECYEGIMC